MSSNVVLCRVPAASTTLDAPVRLFACVLSYNLTVAGMLFRNTLSANLAAAYAPRAYLMHPDRGSPSYTVAVRGSEEYALGKAALHEVCIISR